MCVKVFSQCNRRIPDQYSKSAIFSSPPKHAGRPKDAEKQNAFRIVTKYLARFGDETITLKDLHRLMIDEWSDNETAYSEKQMETAYKITMVITFLSQQSAQNQCCNL